MSGAVLLFPTFRIPETPPPVFIVSRQEMRSSEWTSVRPLESRSGRTASLIARNNHVWRESCLRLFSIQSAYAAALIAPLIAAPAMAQSNSIPSSPVGGGAAELMKDDKQWPMAAKNFANTRFSGLDQINNQNVGELRLAWTFSVGAPRGQEAAPIVVDGTVFVVAPYAGVHPNRNLRARRRDRRP